MEPFDLKLQPVASDTDISNGSFDSFDNVVNYDTSFNSSNDSLPVTFYNINTEQYNWKDYDYSTTSGIQTTNGGIPTGRTDPSAQHQSTWWSVAQGSPPDKSFLVNPDDSLDNLHSSENSPQATATSSQEQLRVLAQISSNTSAVAKKGKRSRRLIARTLTSPSTAIPPPPHRTAAMSNSASTLPPEVDRVPSPDSSSDAAGSEDSSFETVAEALRLQWSVIGNNKSLPPAPPDVVAQIVAEAERKMKAGSSPVPGIGSPTPSPTSLVASGVVTTATIQKVQASTSPLPSGPAFLQEVHKDSCTSPQELTRIIPTEITVEKLQGSRSRSWFSSPESGKSSPGGAAGKEMKTFENSGNTRSPNRSDVGDLSGLISAAPSQTADVGDNIDTLSEASYSSEKELEKYQLPATSLPLPITTDYQLESEEFLRSLPPIKPINLAPYASLPPILPPLSKKSMAKKKSKSSPVTTTSPVTSAKQSASSTLAMPQRSDISTSSSTGSLSMSEELSPIPETAEDVHTHLGFFSTPQRGTRVIQPGSAAGLVIDKKHFEQIQKEKAKLQGQLEILAEESQSLLQERSELQSQLSSLKAKLATVQSSDRSGTDGSALAQEVHSLQQSRHQLEETVMTINRMLAEKEEEIRTLQDELKAAQETGNKLQVRTQELRDDLRAKDMNIQALKNKIAELYVEVQTSIQAKMESETEARTARSDLVSLVKAKEWYQEQLQLAHDVRSKLQKELTMLQGQTISHGTILERLKTESAKLRQQLSESQQRALRDKELLARHLEAIQGDMMEREAAFLEIQRERRMYEETFNSQVHTVEEEKNRLASLQQATSDLEAQLDRAHSEAKRHHSELVTMETGQMETMKRLAVAEESLSEKEKCLEEMEQKLIQMESQLTAAMNDLTKKDSEIMTLKEEKANTEISLKSALQEKAAVDKALEVLKADMGKVEHSFLQMKQELGHRVTELNQVKAEKDKLQEELDRSQHELDIKSRSVDAMTRSFDGQNAAQHGLEAEKIRLERELGGLKIKIQDYELELKEKDRKIAGEEEMITELREKISDLEVRVEEAKDSVPVDKVKIYETEIEDLRLRIRALEDTEREEANTVDEERDLLHGEIAKLKQELLDRQKAYDENVGQLDTRLKELTADKQQLETELGIARRSEELSQLEERDSFTEEIQNLTSELRQERENKKDLEQRLVALQAQRAAEVEALQAKLVEQSAAIEALETQHGLLTEMETANQNLALELEKERGRVLGLSQKNTELKELTHHLEDGLSQRDSALEELKKTVEQSTIEVKERDVKFLDRIAGLEKAVEKEVEVQKDLRKQMGTKIMENKRLKKQQDSSKLELEQLKQDLATSQQLANQALEDLQLANQQSATHLLEAKESSSQAKSLEAELERVKRDFDDNLARQPMLLEQIESLEWELSQKTKEVEFVKEQMKMVESRAEDEINGIKASLQDKQEQIESLQNELSVLRQEKTQQRSQVNELRGALKASVHHYKLTERMNENEDKGTQANLGRKIVIPPLPFDLAVIEKLIRDTRVTPLESKPLDQLSSCLNSLRAEISGLQKQMELHTTAVTTSSNNWKTVQNQVDDLNEVMQTIANTIIAANSTSKSFIMSTAGDREQAEIMNV